MCCLARVNFVTCVALNMELLPFVLLGCFFGTIFEDLCGAMLQGLINCRDSHGNHADGKDKNNSIRSPSHRDNDI